MTVSSHSNYSQTEEYFDTLFGEAVARGLSYAIFLLPSKRSAFCRSIDDGLTAVAAGEADGQNVYVSMGLLARPPRSGRGKEKDVAGIVGAWLDIDIAGPGHKSAKRYPVDMDEADAIVTNAPWRPMLEVLSGHGLQPYWLFSEPWIWQPGDDAERARAKAFMARFGVAANGWAALVGDGGRDLDSVWNLDRLMRVPGTTNRKPPVAPAELRPLRGTRYHAADLEAVLPAAGPTLATGGGGVVGPPAPTRANAGQTGAAVPPSGGRSAPVRVLRPDAEPPSAKLVALLAVDPRLKATLERRRHGMKDQSASAYDMALANSAAAAGWSDQEITNLLIAQRREHHDELKLRQDYYRRTIDKARAAAARAAQIAEAKAQRRAIEEEIENVVVPPPGSAAPCLPPSAVPPGGAGVSQQSVTPAAAVPGTAPPAVRSAAGAAAPGVAPAQPAVTGGVHRAKIIADLRKFTGLPIAGFLKLGLDNATYTLVLDGGHEVELGKASDVHSQDHVRACVWDSPTGIEMRTLTRAAWRKILGLLAAIAEVSENPEAHPVEQLRIWMHAMCQESTILEEPRWVDALEAGLPFRRSGHLHIRFDELRTFVRGATAGRPPADADIFAALRAAGFASVPVGTHVQGKPITRRYWRGPEDFPGIDWAHHAGPGQGGAP